MEKNNKLFSDYVCRLCGVYNEKNKCFYNNCGEIIESDFMYKMQVVYPIIVSNICISTIFLQNTTINF